MERQKSWRWKPSGTRVITANGYVKIKLEDGWIYEHTLVMSNLIGRELRRGESVHHKNGIKDDNSVGNLELWSRGQPAGQLVEDKIKWAKEFLENYGYTIKSA